MEGWLKVEAKNLSQAKVFSDSLPRISG